MVNCGYLDLFGIQKREQVNCIYNRSMVRDYDMVQCAPLFDYRVEPGRLLRLGRLL